MHLTFQIPYGISSFLYKEKGWLSLTSAGLLSIECNHSEKQVPLPLISELIKWAKYFTKLDVCCGFNNVHIKEGDKWK